jgi:chromosome segregation protein
LTRVNDIVSEVTKKVNSLERQAKRADRYNKLTTTLRELEIDFSERELALFHHQMKELKVSEEENQIKKREYENEIERITDHLTKLKQELLALENTLNNKRNEISAQTEKTYNLQNSISISEERKNSLNNSIEKYTHELEDLKNQLSLTVETINNGKEDLLAVTEEIEKNGKMADELTSKSSEFKIQLDGKRDLLKE